MGAQLAVRSRALSECKNHPGTYFEGPKDVDEAYKRFNARITSGEIKLKSGQTRRDLTNLIKAVYDDNSGLSKCPICEKNFGPD
jgi:hypothetical protein